MKTEIHIDPSCREPKLVLVTPELTEAQQALLSRLEQDTSILGYRDGSVTMLSPEDVFRFYTENQRVLCETEGETYIIRLRLYELEQRLEGRDFIRISQGELINLRKVRDFDLSFSGTIRVRMRNGKETYVSRRYVKKLKQALGI